MIPLGLRLMYSKNSNTLSDQEHTLDDQKSTIGHLSSQIGIGLVKMINDSNVNNLRRLPSLREHKVSRERDRECQELGFTEKVEQNG
jgi:hypothetical protein